MELYNLRLPISNPVLIFGIVLFIILLAPLVLKRFRFPGIVGLIISGMFVGPHGINLLARDSSIVLFGTVGLLYIMFIAGLELDLHQFKLNKYKGLTYGLLLFLLPLTLGVYLTVFVLKLSYMQSALISIMLSTNTLVSYPIVIRLGLTKNNAVTTAVGGTIITDTLVLLSLGFIEHFAVGQLNFYYFLQLVFSIALYLVVIFKFFPFITRYYFKNADADNISQYIFILSLVFLGAFLSQLIGLEPIIGAFLSGLALNRLIPNNSVLMGRIEFIGNSIFIPFFLIGVGMLVDINIIINKLDSVGLAFSFFLTSLAGIYLASYVAKKLFHFTFDQRYLVLGLNSSHAAATIAITLVGYNLGVLNETFINATVILILISCIFSSFVVEKFGKKVAVSDSNLPTYKPLRYQRILVPFSNPKTVESLLELALLVKEQSTEAIYPLSVLSDSDSTENTILKNNEQLYNVIRQAESVKVRMQVISRVDTSVPDGIARAIKELVANCVIIGWSWKSNNTGILSNNQLDALLNISNTMILVTKIVHPLNITDKIQIFVPENAELELGCSSWLFMVSQLAGHLGASINFLGFDNTLQRLNRLVKSSKLKLSVSFTAIKEYSEIISHTNSLIDTDLLIIINSRPKGISYNSNYSIAYSRAIRKLEKHNVIVLFPEQSTVFNPDTVHTYSDVLDSSIIEENISIVNKLKLFINSLSTKL